MISQSNLVQNLNALFYLFLCLMMSLLLALLLLLMLIVVVDLSFSVV
jgi:hypothetical protein